MSFQKRRYRESGFKRPDQRNLKMRPTSPSDESRPFCPHYPHCIGCSFINVPYPEQLTRKRDIVAQAMADFPSLRDVEIPPVAPSPRRLGYRARVKLVVRRTKGEVATGLYVPGSHRVIDISSCPVHPRPVNQVLHYLKKKILELGIAPYDERDDSGDLRYLDFRYSFARRELSVTLISRHPVLPEAGRLARSLQRRFRFTAGVIQNINEQRGNVIWGKRFRPLAGNDTILEPFGDLKLVFPAGVFSQANPFTARKLYDFVSDVAGLKGNETVLDLYCGVGPIALYLAATGGQIWAIDDSEASINTAKQNARRNGIANCRFVVGDVAAKAVEAGQMLGRIDLVVVNPPRKGIGAAAMQALLDLDAHRIIYVSCEPHSLVRDLDKFVGSGYEIRRLQPFDMFPQTAEVETVVLAQKP
jgi:23S rRNA (uracil-5-)-methyltransferase RumA